MLSSNDTRIRASASRSYRRLATFAATAAFAFVAGTADASAQADSTAAPPDRWLVQLDTRSFDLATLRDALVVRRDSDRALAIIADFERTIVRDHARFEKACRDLGATVLRHWWLVDACWVKAPRITIEQLREHPDVVRVEADELVAAAGNKPLDNFNHGTDLLHTLGVDGGLSDAVLAVLDSGADIAVNGTFRPHRVFFPNGDPNDNSGGGIAGSRIVYSAQFGALSDDDTHGHGHWVTAIAAGADWGTPSAVDGHAKGARIANYAISDQIMADGSIFAFFSSMTSAWQQIIIDSATMNIVAANNSFVGPQDPLTTLQQALDGAAWVGDILVCVSAGNTGPLPMTGAQSCVNGLAVAAATADQHRVFPSSSRGPVVNDPTRTYPDITAIGIARVPLLDCEVGGEIFGGDSFGGTSVASPRVAGAATVVRDAIPSLFADETKAILLASSQNIADANPTLDANAYGVGFLRNDRALVTAAEFGSHARATINAVSPQSVTLGVPVVPGEEYAIAIAWMRHDTNNTAWSDLNLSVIDGITGTFLAASNSPRNLYEVVRFTAPASGAVVANVSAASLQNGVPQEFAIAATRHPAFRPRRGTFEIVSPGCEGPQPNVDAFCSTLVLNDGATPADLVGSLPFAERYENAVQFIAPAGGVTISGFEFFLRGYEPTALTSHLYLDSGGVPQATATRTSSMQIDEVARWYRTTFAPVFVPGGQRFYLGLENWSLTRVTLTSGPQFATIFSRDACGAPGWGTFSDRVGVRPMCVGTTVGDVPLHLTRGPLVLGQTADLSLERVPPGVATAVILGFSDTFWPGVGPLPFDVSALGGTGCSIQLGVAVSTTVVANALGESHIPLAIGNNPNFLDMQFFSQFVVLDPTSTRQVTTSNLGSNVIGTF